MIKTMSEYLKETTASDTLRDAQKTKPSRDVEVEAMEAFMRLEPAEKTEFLKKALSDSSNDAWNGGKDYSERNRKGLRDNPDNNKNSLKDIRKKIAEAFPGTSDELLDKMTETFMDAVAKKSITEGLLELFADEPALSLLFADDEQLDVVDALAERIQELESDIAWYEDQNQQIYEELTADQSSNNLYEDFIVQAQKPKRRSHNIADDFEPDIENAVLMEDGSSTRSAGDPRMAGYVNFLKQGTIRNPSIPSASLTETWKIFEN